MPDKPTYAQLEYDVAALKRDLKVAREHAIEADAKATRMRFALLGMTVEKCPIYVTVSPEIFDKNTVNAIQALVSSHAKRVAYEIEQAMGAPRVRLREALSHIHYLEGHATNRGLPFTPFGLHEKDKELMNAC